MSFLIRQPLKRARFTIRGFSRLFLSPGQCKECKNFNSMFAIVSGLGHGAVSRLRASWEKLPSKYQRLFSDLQELMDPSRNMSKYRQLVASEQTQPPIVSYNSFLKILQSLNNAIITLCFIFCSDSILSSGEERPDVHTSG